MKIKHFVLGMGIVVIYALMLWQGIQAFYPSPDYEDYCDRSPRAIPSIKDCNFPEGLDAKQQSCYDIGGEFRYDYGGDGCVIGGYCDECRISYDDARDSYSRNIFIISLIVSAVVFVIGLFVLKVEPVGSALLASGLWGVFYGTVWNWRNFSNGLRFGILLVVFILLILIGLGFNKRGWKFWKK